MTLPCTAIICLYNSCMNKMRERVCRLRNNPRFDNSSAAGMGQFLNVWKNSWRFDTSAADDCVFTVFSGDRWLVNILELLT